MEKKILIKVCKCKPKIRKSCKIVVFLKIYLGLWYKKIDRKNKISYKLKLSLISMLNKKKYFWRKTCKTKNIEKTQIFKGAPLQSQTPIKWNLL